MTFVKAHHDQKNTRNRMSILNTINKLSGFFFCYWWVWPILCLSDFQYRLSAYIRHDKGLSNLTAHSIKQSRLFINETDLVALVQVIWVHPVQETFHCWLLFRPWAKHERIRVFVPVFFSVSVPSWPQKGSVAFFVCVLLHCHTAWGPREARMPP